MWLPPATLAACLAAGLGYLFLVRSLRWRLYHAIHAKYQRKMHDITPEEAQEIMDASLHWDMPTLMTNSIAFALFKTYAVVCFYSFMNRCIAPMTSIRPAYDVEGTGCSRRNKVPEYNIQTVCGCTCPTTLCECVLTLFCRRRS